MYQWVGDGMLERTLPHMYQGNGEGMYGCGEKGYKNKVIMGNSLKRTRRKKERFDELAASGEAENLQHQQQADEALRAASTSKHHAQIEKHTIVCTTAIEDAAGRGIERIDEDTEAHKRDIEALATRKKSEISQHQQQRQQEDEAIRAASTSKHHAQIEKHTIVCTTAIEDAADRGIECIDEDVEAHKRDFDLLANMRKAELLQQQQEVDEAFRTERNSFLSLGPFISSDDSRLEDFYVPPRLSEVLQQQISKKNGPRENKTRPITSLEQLLTPADTTKQFTIITANAGVGKTSFCKFVVVLWCALHGRKTDSISTFKKRFDIPFESLEDIPYLLYIPMRDIPPDRTHSIEDIIFAHLENVIGYSTEDRDKLGRVFMKERCLVILDGMDDSSLPKLDPPMAKRKYSIIITCRPWKLADTKLPKYTHVSIDDLNRFSQTNLFEHVNKTLNAYYSTAFEVQDFLATLEAKTLGPLSSNTLVGLQLYCLWHDQRMDNETSENNKTTYRSHKCSIENKVYHFLHKTYQEMFAAIYISSLNFTSEDWLKLEDNFATVFSPDIMSFLCVMNYEQGRRCSEIFGNIEREFYREGAFYASEIIEYQEAVQLAYNECVNNVLCLFDLNIETDNLNLASCGNIKVINLQNLRLRHVTIAPTQLEEFCVFTDNIRENTPPMEQYDKLQQLRLGTLLLPDNISTDLSSFTDLAVVTLQNLGLHHLIIVPDKLEKSWVLVNNKISKLIPNIIEALQSDEQCSNISQIYRSAGFAYIS
ncbi:hypothetical protein MAR_031005 [Mya arenaria]|uniref:NACHT domain-containing protein n=1 Tax=Mya arenaria TaxID=6604 RepID=A0ABY7F5V3_MYAAR|nr:hypothetical protein MAR_031005 [Mya arenaria]